MTTSTQIRAYRGPALLSYGFRPFFLFGALWAAATVAILLPVFSGQIRLPTAFDPIAWHTHEMIFGYVPAIIAGFLLTAVPNWTGRLPVVGTPLGGLVALWGAGRLAVLFSGALGAPLAAAIDLAFLATLAAVVAREILAGEDWRNLKVLVILSILLAANALSHLELIADIGDGHGTRLGIAAIILLISLIGGRIVPSFTRNWLVREASPGRLPVAFNRFDGGVMISTGAALVSWILLPDAQVTAGLALLAMAANTLRLARWAGYRTAAEPLVLVLHVAYAFVPVGFGLVALAILAPHLVLASGAVHGWTIGAIGLMTLSVMTRASLGHTGQTLTATVPVSLLYAAVFVAALARIAVAFGILREPLLAIAASAWVVGFAGFAFVFAPLLARRRA